MKPCKFLKKDKPDSIHIIHGIIHENWGSVKCECGRYHFSEWYCPNAPDHHCHYERPKWGDDCKFHVTLQDGSDFILENEEYIGDYGCIFCGEPDERK